MRREAVLLLKSATEKDSSVELVALFFLSASFSKIKIFLVLTSFAGTHVLSFLDGQSRGSTPKDESNGL